MDIAQWEERVDKLFPVNFLKNEERTLLNDYIEKIENYINIKSRTQEDYIDAFIAYKHAIQSIARLSDL